LFEVGFFFIVKAKPAHFAVIGTMLFMAQFRRNVVYGAIYNIQLIVQDRQYSTGIPYCMDQLKEGCED